MLCLEILAVSESCISPSVQNVSVLLPLALCHSNLCEFYFCGHMFFYSVRGQLLYFRRNTSLHCNHFSEAVLMNNFFEPRLDKLY